MKRNEMQGQVSAAVMTVRASLTAQGVNMNTPQSSFRLVKCLLREAIRELVRFQPIVGIKTAVGTVILSMLRDGEFKGANVEVIDAQPVSSELAVLN